MENQIAKFSNDLWRQTILNYWSTWFKKIFNTNNVKKVELAKLNLVTEINRVCYEVDMCEDSCDKCSVYKDIIELESKLENYTKYGY